MWRALRGYGLDLAVEMAVGGDRVPQPPGELVSAGARDYPGLRAQVAAGPVPGDSGPRTGSVGGFGRAASAQGLEYTILIMLAVLLVSGLIVIRARRTYPHDVASVVESERQPRRRARQREAAAA